jgi:hypothetical protein
MSDFFVRFKDLSMLSFFQVAIAILALCFAECALGLAPFAIAMAMMGPLAWVAMVCAICFLYRRHSAVQGSANNPIVVVPHYHPVGASANNPIVIDGNPVPPAAAAAGIPHVWCADRHKHSARTHILPADKVLSVYHLSGKCYGVQVAEIDGLIVVIRADGNVDWLHKHEARGYRQRFLDLKRNNEVDHVEHMKAHHLASIWIKEHRDITLWHRASEQGLAAGRPYNNTSPVRRKYT